MPKITVPPLPVSCLFGMIKPSGPTSMSLLNDMQPLLSKSRLFEQPPLEAPKRKKKRSKKVGDVKVGQGGTLDPLADGILGEWIYVCCITEDLTTSPKCLELVRVPKNSRSFLIVPKYVNIQTLITVDTRAHEATYRNIPRLVFWAVKRIHTIAKGLESALHPGNMSRRKRWWKH